MNKTLCCDKCGQELKASAHDVVLRDLGSHQELGRYCVPGCLHRAVAYMVNGGALRMTMRHPSRCDPGSGHCADGYDADPALLLFRWEGG